VAHCPTWNKVGGGGGETMHYEMKYGFSEHCQAVIPAEGTNNRPYRKAHTLQVSLKYTCMRFFTRFIFHQKYLRAFLSYPKIVGNIKKVDLAEVFED
jgi:hypothetical protein